MNKPNFKKIFFTLLLSSLGVLLLCVAALFIHYKKVTNAFDDDHFRDLVSEGNKTGVKAPLLEEGSIIRANDLEQYLLLSDINAKPADWLNEHADSFSRVKDKIVLNTEVPLPNLAINHCNVVYCYQHRLAIPNMPVQILQALLLVEDSRFLEHSGIDLKAILRALWKDLKAMKLVEGASTITQQLVKNLYLNSEKSFSRKFNEMILSYYLEHEFSKEEIISIYLNEVFWGVTQSTRLKGTYAASLAYFGKHPQELTFYESIMLVAMLKGPGLYNPAKPVLLKQRVDGLVQAIKGRSVLGIGEINEWSETDWKKWSERYMKHSKERDFRIVVKLNNFKGSLLDDWSKFILLEEIENFRDKMSLEKEAVDYAVKIGVFDRNFQNDEYGFTYSKFERDLSQAFDQEYHQVGSILKPVIYDIFTTLGKDLDDKVSLAPFKMRIRSGVWGPKEVSQSTESEMTLLKALQKSKNNPVIRIASELGFDSVEEKLKAYVPKLKTPLKEYPAQLLGSVELSIWDIAKTYQAFIQSVCERVRAGETDFDETVLHLQASNQETTISHTANDIFKEIVFFGKTGTTNEGKDAWFIGFDGKNIYVVWVGHETMNKNSKSKFSGAASAFSILQGYLTYNGKRVSESSCNF